MFRKSLPLVRKHFQWPFRQFNCNRGHSFLAYKHLYLTQKTNLPVKIVGNVNFILKNSRSFAKGRDIKKDKKKKVQIDESELGEFFNVENLFTEIGKPLESFKLVLSEHVTLRSTHGAIENLKVEFEGDKYTIQDLAEVGKKNPRLYVLDFSSFPQTIQAVISALQKSELNLNVQQEGTRVFIPIPKVTREHRQVMTKKSNLYFHKFKEEIREIQNKYLKKLRNIENLSEDIKYRVKDQLTALGDKQIMLAEEILKAKQEELMKEEDEQII